MKIKQINLIVMFITILSLVGFTQNLYADEGKALSVVEKVRKATNSQNFDALGKLFSDDFEIEITRCNQTPITQDKQALFEEMSGAFEMLNDYIKESKIISTEKKVSGYIVVSDTVEYMSVKEQNKLLKFESIETYHIIDSAEEPLVSKIFAVQKCQ